MTASSTALRLAALGLAAAMVNAQPAHAEDAAPAMSDAMQALLKQADTGRTVDGIAAVVGKRIVLLSDVERALEPMMQAAAKQGRTVDATMKAAMRTEVIETLVAEKLIEQEVARLHVAVTQPEIDRVVEGMKSRNNLSDAQLEQALLRQGLTLDEYKEGIKKQLTRVKIVQLKVKARVQVSDADVEAAFRQREAVTAVDVKLRARHMVFIVPKDAPADVVAAKRAQAAAALKAVRDGASFADVATARSEGPSASRGGALGVFGRGTIMPAFEEAAFAAPVGEPVGPVRTPVGWHVLLVEERVKNTAQAFEAVKDKLREELYEQRVGVEFERYLQELRATTYVEIR